MTNPNPFIKNLRESAGLRLSVLFGSFFILLLITGLISSIINGSSSGSGRTHYLINSCMQCILAFCVPAFLLARFSSNNPIKWLKLNKIPDVRNIIGVILIYLCSMPTMEWIIEWNANLHFPAALSGLEEMMRGWENKSQNLTDIILDVHSFPAVLAGIIIIGILTGFSEELFFRGGLQGILTRSNISKNLAVWLAAFIFSFMHFQFFGFIPRLLLGAFFGYLLLWSGSIWVPVFAHIFNNSFVVISGALKDPGLQGAGIHSLSDNMWQSPIFLIGSVLVTGLLLTVLRPVFFKPEKLSTANGEKIEFDRL